MSTPVEELTSIARLGTAKRELQDHVHQIYNVKNFGALGDNSHDDTANVQACFDAAFLPLDNPAINANLLQNKMVFFPPGIYKTSDTLTLPQVESCSIVGSGKHSTVISNVTSTSVVMQTDGFSHSLLRDMKLKSVGGVGSVGFLWEQTSAILGTFGVSFINMAFDGAEVGFQASLNGLTQSSETLFVNCDFVNAALYGMDARGAGNTLNFMVHGGYIANCTRGITGCCISVQGVRFENNSNSDVTFDSNGGVILGCSSSSDQFVVFEGADGAGTSIKACYHTGTGDFSRAASGVAVDCCVSAGKFSEFSGEFATNRLFLRNNSFSNPNVLTAYPPALIKQNV